MATLYLRDLPDETHEMLAIAAIKAKKPLKVFTAELIKAALDASITN